MQMGTIRTLALASLRAPAATHLTPPYPAPTPGLPRPPLHQASRTAPVEGPTTTEMQLVKMPEDHITLHADNTQANRAVTRTLSSCEASTILRSLDGVFSGLRVMGFRMDNNLPW